MKSFFSNKKQKTVGTLLWKNKCFIYCYTFFLCFIFSMAEWLEFGHESESCEVNVLLNILFLMNIVHCRVYTFINWRLEGYKDLYSRDFFLRIVLHAWRLTRKNLLTFFSHSFKQPAVALKCRCYHFTETQPACHCYSMQRELN